MECIVCSEQYDIEKAKNEYGEQYWAYSLCSSHCVTKYLNILNFFILDIEEIGLEKDERVLFEDAKEKTFRLLEVLRKDSFWRPQPKRIPPLQDNPY